LLGTLQSADAAPTQQASSMALELQRALEEQLRKLNE
jgi:hypothetical protein